MIVAALPNDFGDLQSLTIRLIIAVTLVWLLAGAFVLFTGRASAAVRHRAWALSNLAVLSLPLALCMLPELRVGWLEPGNSQTVFRAPQFLGAESETMLPDIVGGERPRTASIETAIANPDQFQPPEGRPELSAKEAAPVLSRWWLVLFVPMMWSLVRLICAEYQAHRVAVSAEPIEDAHCLQLLGQVRWALGSPTLVTLKTSAQFLSPVCVGWRSPTIILPNTWRAESDEALRATFAHELAHVIRGDLAWQFLARLACAVYWFHPLAWVAAWRMRVDRESACDDCVLQVGTQPTVYARLLIDLHSRLLAARLGLQIWLPWHPVQDWNAVFS